MPRLAADSNPPRVVLYARVSTDEQAASGLGLGAQLDELKRAADYHRWNVVRTIRDEGASAKTLARPGLLEALQLVADDRADIIAVSKLDRLSRSQIDFGLLVEHLDNQDAGFIALDVNVDTTTAAGMMVVNVLMVMAQWEREAIAERTRSALAELKRQGRPVSGPAVTDHPELAQRIRSWREQGWSLQAIADQLNLERVPTLRGGTEWRPSSVSTAAGIKRRKPRRKSVALPQRKRGTR